MSRIYTRTEVDGQWVCPDDGTVVGDRRVHDNWHQDQANAQAPAPIAFGIGEMGSPQ